MKNLLLVFLIIVAICELITLGIINFKKSQFRIASAKNNHQDLQSPTPSETPETASVGGFDYLGALTSASPSATQVGSLSLKATTLPTTSPTPTRSPTPVATVIPSPSPSATPSPVATPTTIVQVTYSSAEINMFVDRYAGQYGVDPNSLRHIALCESNFNPSAVNLGYVGLFQFSSPTWQNYRKKMGEDPNSDLRFNAEESVQTAAYVLSKGGSNIWPSCKP